MEKKPIGFKIKDIEIDSVNVLPRPNLPLQGSFKFDIRVETRVESEQKYVIPFVHIKIRNEDLILAELTIALMFEIPDFDEQIIQDDEGFYTVPEDFDTTLTLISIS